MIPRLMNALIVVLLLAGCSPEGGEASTNNEQETPTSAATNRIDIPPVVRNNLGISFANVERRDVANTIRVPGAFELQPLARHEYRMILSGRVELLVDQYAPVEPGDVLFRFQSPEWPELQHEIIIGEQNIESARAEIEVAQAKIDEADAQLALMQERLEALASAEFKRADLEAEAAELEASLPRLAAELRLAQTKLANGERTREHALYRAAVTTGFTEQALALEVAHQGTTVPAYRAIDWIEVTATESGVVETLAVTDGAFVEPPTVVVSTVDPKKVRFRAMGLQSDLPRLTHGAKARIVPPRTPGLSINDAVAATVTIGLEADPDQRTIMLLALPEELRSWTRAGVSAFLEVVVESTAVPALAIPRSAILKDGITHVFFRRDPQDPNKAIRVEADMGVDDGRWVVINSGIALGDEVVVDGVYALMLAVAGSTQQGGHFHADGTFHEGEDE